MLLMQPGCYLQKGNNITRTHKTAEKIGGYTNIIIFDLIKNINNLHRNNILCVFYHKLEGISDRKFVDNQKYFIILI